MHNRVLQAALVGTLLSVAAPAQAETPPSTAVVISLSDTAAQKASLQKAREAESESFFKRRFGTLFTRSEEHSASQDASPDESAESLSKREQRDMARGRKKGSSDFDDHFRKYTKHYFGIATDWRWFQAQAMVESEMKPATRSHSGAMGLMQIMPRTFKEIRSRNPHLTDPFDPHLNIAAGIYYNRQLFDAWSEIDNIDDRRRFMFASYNAGLGNVQRSAKRVGNPGSFAAVAPALPPGPRHYLVKIERERQKLLD